MAEIGQVPASWEVDELRSYLELITYGFTNPMPTTEVGPWKITAKDIIDGSINYNSARRTSQEAFTDKLTNKSRPRIGDILLTKDGSIGRVAVVDREGLCINQSVALLRPNKKIDPFFLKYLLLSPHYQRVMERDSDGAVIKHIYITRVDKMEVAIPPLDEQSRILSVVKTLDDKIELNRRMNRTLEAVAQAIFKSWFVDFEPVKAKASAKAAGGGPEEIARAAMADIAGKTEAELAQLPEAQQQSLAQTAALFPDSFQNSELGEVPEGWDVKELGEFVTVTKGRSYESGELAASDTALVTLKSFHRGGGYRDEGLKPYIGDFNKNQEINPGELIIAYTDVTQSADVVGKPAIVRSNDSFSTLVASLDVGIVRPTCDRFSSGLLYFLFRAHRVDHHMTSYSTGTTVLHLDKNAINKVLVPLIPLSLVGKFTELANSVSNRIDQNSKESRTLSEMRDALLPRLLSGEIRLSGSKQ